MKNSETRYRLLKGRRRIDNRVRKQKAGKTLLALNEGVEDRTKQTSTLTACFLPFFGGEIIYLPKTCILAKAFGDPSYVAEWKIHELHWQQLLYCVFDLDWYFKHSIMVLRNCINSHGSRGGRAPLKTLSFSKGKTISPIFDLLFHQESRHFRSIVRFRNMYCIKIGATS